MTTEEQTTDVVKSASVNPRDNYYVNLIMDLYDKAYYGETDAEEIFAIYNRINKLHLVRRMVDYEEFIDKLARALYMFYDKVFFAKDHHHIYGQARKEMIKIKNLLRLTILNGDRDLMSMIINLAWKNLLEFTNKEYRIPFQHINLVSE